MPHACHVVTWKRCKTCCRKLRRRVKNLCTTSRSSATPPRMDIEKPHAGVVLHDIHHGPAGFAEPASGRRIELRGASAASEEECAVRLPYTESRSLTVRNFPGSRQLVHLKFPPGVRLEGSSFASAGFFSSNSAYLTAWDTDPIPGSKGVYGVSAQ